MKGRSRALTSSQKILIHLLEYGSSNGYEFSGRVTQRGISKTLNITQSMTSYALKSLKKRELVSEKLGRVRGEKRRIKVYTLTPKGFEIARKLREELCKGLLVEDDGNLMMLNFDEISEIVRKKWGFSPDLPELIGLMDENGVISMQKIASMHEEEEKEAQDATIFGLTFYAIEEGIRLTKNILKEEMETIKKITSAAKEVGKKKVQKIKKLV